MKIENEKDIEKYLVRKCKEKGYLCFKFLSHVRGVPDRIIITTKGDVIFIELKGTKGVLSPMQKLMIEKLKNNKALVFVVSSKKDIDTILERENE